MDYIRLLRALLQTMNQAELAKEIGATQATVSRWLKGQKMGGEFRDKLIEIGRERHLVGDDLDQPKPMRRRHTGDIPNLKIHSGAGNGGALSVTVDLTGNVAPEDTDGFWSFPESIKAAWRGMAHTYAFPVIGDSMEPTLKSGSVAFVDTSHTIPSPEDIYACDYGDGLVIKRVKLIPNTDRIRIISDNERYGSDELQRNDVRVYGRVVAWFQWRG